MIVAADEVTRSLSGVWGLLQRDAAGLRQFDASQRGLRRSFAAIFLAAPAFVIALAAERERLGLLLPGTSLTDDPGLILRLLVMFLAAWALPPLIALLIYRGETAQSKKSLSTFTVASNWSAVLAAFFVAMPAYMLARGLATPALTAFYLIAFGVLIAHMRWFTARLALGVSGTSAACLIGTDMGLEMALGHLLALT